MSLEITIFYLKMMLSRLFILKFTEPLQSCCCPVQKYLPRIAKLALHLSRYLWRGLVNFKINSRPLFTIIFKLKNDNFKFRDFSPIIERVLAGVSEINVLKCDKLYMKLVNTPITFDGIEVSNMRNQFSLETKVW